MPAWKAKLMVAIGLVLVWTVAHAEFYRYIDANGRQRFTDDLAAVPPDQRPTVKTYQSAKSEPVQPAADHTPRKRMAYGTAPSPGRNTPQAGGAWNERIAGQANELDRMQVELNKTYRTLQAERESLAAKAPPAGAGADERAAYGRQVKQLNRKIDDYEARYAEFKKKEKAFNNKYRK